MKILVLGATGPTGLQLVQQALDRDYMVTAVVRNPSKMSIRHSQLKIIECDILNEEALTSAISGHDAVLSALGSGRDLKSNIISRAMNVLIPAMKNAGVQRLVFLSSFGVGETRKRASLFSRLIFALLLKHVLKDKETADNALRRSGLNYTLVYPTALTNGTYTGTYQSGIYIQPGWFPRISRADVADFMLKQLTSSAFLRRTVIITN